MGSSGARTPMTAIAGPGRESAAAHGEVGQPVVSEGGPQPGPEVVVHSLMIEREAFGELGGEPLPLAQGSARTPIGHLRVEALVDSCLCRPLGAGSLTDGAVVDQRDRPSRGLAAAARQLRVAVDGVGQGAHADGHLRPQQGPVDVLAQPRSGNSIRAIAEGRYRDAPILAAGCLTPSTSSPCTRCRAR